MILSKNNLLFALCLIFFFGGVYSLDAAAATSKKKQVVDTAAKKKITPKKNSVKNVSVKKNPTLALSPLPARQGEEVTFQASFLAPHQPITLTLFIRPGKTIITPFSGKTNAKGGVQGTVTLPPFLENGTITFSIHDTKGGKAHSSLPVQGSRAPTTLQANLSSGTGGASIILEGKGWSQNEEKDLVFITTHGSRVPLSGFNLCALQPCAPDELKWKVMIPSSAPRGISALLLSDTFSEVSLEFTVL